jgi:hypothetical protein
MNVPSYQMHNVLNVYSRQLRQNLAAAEKSKPPARLPQDQVKLTPEVKRQATIEKVSRDILTKISRYGSRDGSRQGISEQADVNSEASSPPAKAEKRAFVFNAIDQINIKSTNTLSVDDSSFLIERLDQLAKRGIDKKPATGT